MYGYVRPLTPARMVASPTTLRSLVIDEISDPSILQAQ